MSGSYTRRGLAALAVSALAVTGAPWLASPASAAASAVTIYAPFSGTASAKNDGVNTKIHLLADAPAQYGTGATAVDVKGMKFEYQITGSTTWTTIGTTMTRPFSVEWDAPGSLDGLSVTVRATPVDAAGAAIADPTAVATDMFTINNSKSSVDIANAPLSEVGVFGGKAVVTGTTSGGAVGLSNRTWTTDLPDPASLGGAATDAVRPFEGVVDVDTFDDTDTAADEIVVGAQADPTAVGSDDAEMLSVYNQKVTDASVSPMTSVVPEAGKSTFTVTVKDQKGKPVLGALVEPSVAVDEFPPHKTGVDGKVSFHIDAGTADRTIDFVVNSDGTAGYDPQTDFKISATQDVYTAVATALSIATPKGDIFDDNEASNAGVVALVKDQNDNPMVDQVVWYRDVFTPRDTTKPVDTGAWASDKSGSEGKVSLPVDGRDGVHRLESYIVKDGVPGPSAGDLQASPVSVKVGPAAIAWAAGKFAEPGAGTTTVQKATLALPDGTVLPNRDVSFTYTPSAGADSRLADQTGQPAGTTRSSDTAGSAKTGSDGSFSVAVFDPAAVPNVDEKGDSLSATGTGFAPSALTIDFLKVNTPQDIDFGAVTALIDGAMTPGRPVNQTLTVFNAPASDTARTALSDVQVQISVDNGFFTPYAATKDALVPASAPGEGTLYGSWKDLGASQDLTTGDATGRGSADYSMAIGYDPGFDVDGIVETKVTATAGSYTETMTVPFKWTTNGYKPLNPSDTTSIEVKLSDKQQSSVLPWAYNGQYVSFDVHARDQFGNLVEAPVTVGDNDANDVARYGAGPTYSSNFPGEAPSFDAYIAPGYAGTIEDLAQTVNADWAAERNTWTDGNATTAGFQPSRKTTLSGVDNPAVKDSADTAIHWYSQSYDEGASYTLTHDTTDVVKVGTPVVETVTALDQHEQALSGATVQFFRAGPDANQNGEVKGATPTDPNGRVSYTYAGAVQGDGVTSAVVARNGAVIRKLSDTVSFDATPRISAPASRKGAGGVAIAGTTRPGAEVVLFRMNSGESTFTEVGSQIADVEGAYRFVKSLSKSAQFYVRVDDVASSAVRYVKVIEAPTLSLSTDNGWTTARVNTNPDLAGQTVNLYRVNSDGSKTRIRSTETGRSGNATFHVNTAKGKTYKFVARVTTGQGVYGAWTSVKSIKSS